MQETENKNTNLEINYENIQKQLQKNEIFQLKGIQNINTHKLVFRKFSSSSCVDFNEILIEKPISEGSYGIIYKAKWRDCTVAVKKFKITIPSEQNLRDFLSECYALNALRHPNIVNFLGACTQMPNLCIILEYCQRGSLWSYVQNLENNISWECKKKFALDIARGINFLHCSTPKVIHRDIKSLNILLDDSLKCKLADFGWTKCVEEFMSNKIGTYQWMAPEVICGNQYTEKADVFSFGIVLWEICVREPPYKNKTGLAVCKEVLEDQLRPCIPKKIPEKFQNLMKQCWEQNPEIRPSFKEVIKTLESIQLK